MINSQSLVGLTHQEAVDVLRSTAGLIQLVVASKVQPMKHAVYASHVNDRNSSLDFRSKGGFCIEAKLRHLSLFAAASPLQGFVLVREATFSCMCC